MRKEIKVVPDWIDRNINKDNFPKVIQTTKCPHCGNNTLNHYSNNTSICGMCMTWAYEIKKK